MGKDKLIGEVTPEQIAEWKKKHGPGKRFVIDGHVAYLRYPTRVEVSYANSIASKDPIKSNEQFLKTIWLGGSDEIKTNNQFFFAITPFLKDMLTTKEVEVEDF